MYHFLELDNLSAFGLIFLRMAGCIGMNPILARRNVPAYAKTGMILMMTLLIYSFSDISSIGIISSTVEYIVVGLKEFCVGLVIGFIVSLFSYIVILGGEVMDMQMGLSMAKVYDPASNVSLSLTSTFYNVLFIFAFFNTNGHLTLFKLFLDSEKVVPYGHVILSPEASSAIVDVFCQCTVLGLKLAMPMMALQFMIEMGVGVLMKSIPQINVIMINIQAKIFVGLILLVVIYAPTVNFMEYAVETMFKSISDITEMLG